MAAEMIQRTPEHRGRSSSRSCQRALHEAMPLLPHKARHVHSHACRSTLLLQQRHSQVGALDSGIAPRVPRWMLVSTNGHQIANPALISLRSERVQPPRLHNTSQPGRPTKAEIGMMSNLGMLQNRLLCVSIAGFKKRWQPTTLTSALYISECILITQEGPCNWNTGRRIPFWMNYRSMFQDLGMHVLARKIMGTR